MIMFKVYLKNINEFCQTSRVRCSLSLIFKNKKENILAEIWFSKWACSEKYSKKSL